jgi:hypothetical protein
MTVHPIDRTHNRPPEALDTVAPPEEDTVLDDLRARYPKVEADFADIERSFKECPPRIGDDDDETAAAAQELAKKMAVTLKSWEQARTNEKGPWQKMANCVSAFFSTKSDKVETMQKDVKGRLRDYLERKADKARAEREAKAKAQREEADRLAREASAAEARKLAAEKAAREAVEREERARVAAAEQERLRVEAEARAKAAREEEARIARDKAAREAKDAAERHADLGRLIELVGEADGLNMEIELGRCSPANSARFDALIGQGGEISVLGAKLLRVVDLLSEADRKHFASLRERTKGHREDREVRAAKERAAQADAERKAKAQEALMQDVKFIHVTMVGVGQQWDALKDEPYSGRKDLDRLVDENGFLQAKIAGALASDVIDDAMHGTILMFDEFLDEIRAARSLQLKKKQADDDEAALIAQQARERAEREASEAQAKAKAAKAEIKEAMADQREAASTIKEAVRDEKLTFGQAAKAESRADRMETALEGTTDADLSRTRSEHGTVGSLATRWVVAEIDYDKVPLERLRPYLDRKVMDAAIYHFMRAHMKEWGSEVVRDALEGVTFEKSRESRVV